MQAERTCGGYELFDNYLCKRKFNGLKQKLKLATFQPSTQTAIVDTLNTNLQNLKIVKHGENKEYRLFNKVYLEKVNDGTVNLHCIHFSAGEQQHEPRFYFTPDCLLRFTQGC